MNLVILFQSCVTFMAQNTGITMLVCVCVLAVLDERIWWILGLSKVPLATESLKREK